MPVSEQRRRRLAELVARRGQVSNRDVARALGVSPATSHRLLHSLVVEQVLERRGRGPAVRYGLRRVRHRFRLAGLDEQRAWERVAAAIGRIRPLPGDELRSLRYAATEVINNAVEHSRGQSVEIRLAFEAGGATLVAVKDDGVGAFRRACEDFGLDSPQEAIVQIEQGKLTSDPSRHSGEGLFFSSKAVARFRLESQGVAWIVDNLIPDSAIGPSEVRKGTLATLTVVRDRTPRLEEVFRRYTDPETLGFTKTRTTIKLSTLGTALVSRSEAKQVVRRLAEFAHVTLDFSGVEMVGQGFCDEVFRIFRQRHPEVTLEPVGMSESVAFMVARARARAS